MARKIREGIDIPTCAPPVRFMIDMQQGVDAYAVKENLEARASGLSVHILELKNIGMQYVHGSADAATYESLFNAKLAYQTKIIQNLNRGPYAVREWVEICAASVPSDLEDKIKRIYLEPKMYLTD